MWKILFFMVTWQKIFIWLLLKVYSCHLRVCASSNSPYMVWNKRLEHGIKNSAQLYLGSPLLRVNMILLYLFIERLLELSYFFCMLMIWLLLVLIMLLFKALNSSYKQRLIWKILEICIILLVLRFIYIQGHIPPSTQVCHRFNFYGWSTID